MCRVSYKNPKGSGMIFPSLQLKTKQNRFFFFSFDILDLKWSMLLKFLIRTVPLLCLRNSATSLVEKLGLTLSWYYLSFRKSPHMNRTGDVSTGCKRSVLRNAVAQWPSAKLATTHYPFPSRVTLIQATAEEGGVLSNGPVLGDVSGGWNAWDAPYSSTEAGSCCQRGHFPP